jgi:MacB-like periplasmic core domain/FtsX-like permease family
MNPALALAAHKLRGGWRAWAALALLTALAGGVVLTAVAGAIRTDTAYPRFLAASHAADMLVAPAESGTGGYDAAVGTLPGVTASAAVVGLLAQPANPDGTPDNSASVIASLDGRYGRVLEIPKMLAGRLPAANAPDEMAVSQVGARQLHLHVGSALPVVAADESTPPHVRRLTAHVTGIFVDSGSVVAVNYQDQAPQLWASAALYRELGPGYTAFDGAFVTVRPGTSVSALTASAQALARRYRATGGQVFVADESAQAATVERAIRPQAVALALFALAVALTALLIVGQVAARALTAAAADNATLAALGMTRRQLLGAGLLDVAAAVAAGSAAAVLIAIAASPLMPIGPARLAEPDPGVTVNGPVLAIGFAGICVLLLARVAGTAWRQASVRPATAGSTAEPAGPRRGTRLVARLAAAGAPLAAVTGVRLALDPGHGRASVSVRSALLGLAVAVAAVAVAVTFGANLLRLVDTPRLYGQDWDIAIEGQFGTLSAADFARTSGHVPGMSDVTFGVHGTVSIGGTVIPAIGLAAGTGPVMSSTVLSGRPPATADEIALGASVLRRLGLHLGQLVTVTTPDGPRRMRVTGSAVFPYFGQGSFTPTDAGQGAEVTATVLEPQASAAEAGSAGYNFALVKFAPGPSRQADMAAFQRAWAPFCASIGQSTCLVTDQRPNTVNNFAAIDATPAVLAAVLGLLGLGVLAQFTVSAARRSRRDYAILKVLGLARRDLRSVAFCQAVIVTVAALVVGVPLGIAAGRLAWQLFAGQAGLPPDAITPLSVLWLIPATAAAALLVAVPVARSVARLPAAAVLRTE